MTSIKQNFQYYLDNQDVLVQKFNKKYVVIKDCQVIGVYDTQALAVTETSKSHELGSFLVQLVGAGRSGYTQTFHSRVNFV